MSKPINPANPLQHELLITKDTMGAVIAQLLWATNSAYDKTKQLTKATVMCTLALLVEKIVCNTFLGCEDCANEIVQSIYQELSSAENQTLVSSAALRRLQEISNQENHPCISIARAFLAYTDDTTSETFLNLVGCCQELVLSELQFWKQRLHQEGACQ